MPKQTRLRLVIAHTLHVIALALTFALALVASLFLNLNLRTTRRFVASAVTYALADLFEGKLVIDRVDHISLAGLRGARVRVLDDTGVQVGLVDDVNVNAWVIGIVKSALVGSDDITIALSKITITYADVSLDQNGQDLRLARAFQPKPTPKKPSTGPSRGVKVEVSELVIVHAWVHGTLQPVPPLDVDADDIRARINVVSEAQPSDDVRVSLPHIHLLSRNAPYRADLNGDADGSLDLPLGTGKQLAANGGYHGTAAGIPVHLHAGIDGRKVDAVVDVPRVEVDRVQQIVPGAPLAALASAHAEAHGTLDALDATAHAQIGQGLIDGKAKIVLTPSVKIDADVALEHMDARAFVKTAPETDVSAKAKASIALQTAGVVGSYRLDVAPGAVAKNATPAVHITGNLQPTVITAAAQIEEPGAPTTVTARLDIPKSTIVFEAHAVAAQLANISQIRNIAHGSADVRAHGTVDLANSAIDADYEVLGHHLEASSIQVSHVETNGHIKGPFATPIVTVAVHAHAFQTSGMNVQTVDAHAKIAVGPAITIDGATVDMSAQKEHIKVSVDRVVAQGGGVKLEGATIDGLGELIGVDAQYANGLLAASVHAHDVELAKVSRVLGTADTVRSGRISINADVRLTRNDAQGSIVLDLKRADIGPVTDGVAHVDAKMMGRKIFANVHLDTKKFGRVDINTSTIELNGSPLAIASWTRATGDAQIDGELFLPSIQPYLPPGLATDLQGTVVIDGEVKRTDPHAAPSVEIDIDTKGLAISHAPSWRVDGVDISLAAKVGSDGHAQVTSRIHDKIGDVLTAAATADLPMDEMMAFAPTKATLLKTAANIDLEIPERKLDSFPSILGLKSYKGKIQASVKASGNYLAPNVSAVVRAVNIRTPDLPLKFATSGEMSATYDGKVIDVKGNVVAQKKTVLQVDAQANVLWHDALVFGASPDIPWTASAHALLSAFPLQAVTPLSDRGVKGNLSGEVSVTDLHKNAHADAMLAFDDLKVGKAKYTNCYTRATLDEKGATAYFRIDQSDGFAEATGTAGAIWGANLVPAIDQTKNVQGSFVAKNLSAAVAQPFVDSIFNQLDGRVDANVKATIPPTGTPSVQGTVALRDGIVQSPTVGEEFHDISLTVKVAPQGTDTVATVPNIVAYGTTGKIMASATARMHGVNFAGANLVAVVPKTDAIQLTLEGQDYGEGYGNLTVAVAVPEPQHTTIKVSIPSFHVNIPELASRSLQDLDPAVDVHLGVQRPGQKFVELDFGVKAETPTPSNSKMDVDIQMGSDVDVKVSDLVRAQLSGGPHIAIAQTTVVTGKIALNGGQLNVQGKQFDIQQGGSVTFNGGDPGNPDIVVSALWPAPDGTRVYADFNGPLKTGKVTLHSEPAKSENEILSLILFGSGDEQGAQSSESSGTQAASTAGGFATQGLSKAIGDLTGIDAQVKIDTSEANNPKPEVQVQITRTISIELATVLGIPPFGDNPDTNFVTLDWRFRPRWSIATTFGNRGSSIVDLLWQYRY